MSTSEQCVLREGPPRALDELRALLAEHGVDSKITKANGCAPGG